MMTACFFLFFYWFMLCLLTLCKSRQKYMNQYEEKKNIRVEKKNKTRYVNVIFDKIFYLI